MIDSSSNISKGSHLVCTRGFQIRKVLKMYVMMTHTMPNITPMVASMFAVYTTPISRAVQLAARLAKFCPKAKSPCVNLLLDVLEIALLAAHCESNQRGTSCCC